MEYKIRRPFKEWIILNIESLLSGRGYVKRTITGYSYHINPEATEKNKEFDKSKEKC